MDLLNSIAHMRGPEFLVLYSIFCLLAVCLSAVWARRCDPLPPMAALPAEPHAGSDPYEFAWLRGGTRAMIATALFALRQQGAVVVSDREAVRSIATPGRLGIVEGLVYASLTRPRKLAELMKDKGLAAAVGGTGSRYEAKYASAGFATTPTERSRAFRAMLAGLAAVLGLGATKLFVAISTGHSNVGFLILIGAVVSVVIAAVCWPKRLNARGRAYLKDIKSTYGTVSQSVAHAPAEAMLPLYVGLLGTAVLAGTPYDDFNRELQAVRASSGGSCGSGCGSSGGDGGGDGGGGCGGGGCGGCGG